MKYNFTLVFKSGVCVIISPNIWHQQVGHLRSQQQVFLLLGRPIALLGS